MNFPFSTQTGWLIAMVFATGLMMLFLSSCGCCGRGSSHVQAAPCRCCFEERALQGVRRTYPVNILAGKGRVVLLLHEANGQSPGTLWLAKELGDAGCKVYVPRFFGGYGSNHGVIYTLKLLGNPDWNLFSATDSGAIRGEVKALTEAIAKENPGRKITVIGNCMTGSLPLELLQNESVDTAIVCQPALPFFSRTNARKTSYGLPREVVDRSLQILADNPHKRLIHFNYLGDTVGIIERSQYLAGRTHPGKAAARHELYIGVGPATGGYYGSPGAKALPAGAQPLYTEKVKNTLISRAHSTITGATGKDLEIYRQRLFEVLGLKRAG